MGIKHNPADSSCLEETPKLNAVLRREKGCKFLPICTVDEWGGGTCYYTLDCLGRRRWVLRRFTFRSFTFEIFAFMKNKGCKKNSQVYFLSPLLYPLCKQFTHQLRSTHVLPIHPFGDPKSTEHTKYGTGTTFLWCTYVLQTDNNVNLREEVAL